jgi:hypothetical protein
MGFEMSIMIMMPDIIMIDLTEAMISYDYDSDIIDSVL